MDADAASLVTALCNSVLWKSTTPSQPPSSYSPSPFCIHLRLVASFLKTLTNAGRYCTNAQTHQTFLDVSWLTGVRCPKASRRNMEEKKALSYKTNKSHLFVKTLLLIHIYTCACMYVHIHTHVNIYTHAYVQAHTCACAHTNTHF